MALRHMVRLGGAAARSDKDGNFSIAALTGGRYPVILDTARVGYKHLSSAANPDLVEVTNGEDEPLDLWLTTAGLLRGTVTRDVSETERWSSTDRSLLEDPGEELIPVAGIIVEIADGHSTHRRVTGADGEFLFEILRPGKWTLSTVGRVPDGYQPILGDRRVTISPGGEHQTTLELRSRRTEHRRIPTDRDAPLQIIGFGAATGARDRLGPGRPDGRHDRRPARSSP